LRQRSSRPEGCALSVVVTKPWFFSMLCHNHGMRLRGERGRGRGRRGGLARKGIRGPRIPV